MMSEIYYSSDEVTRGFYFEDRKPEGAKAITLERHAELLGAQAEGAEILPDNDGYPYAQMHIVTLEQVKAQKCNEIKEWAQGQEELLTGEYTLAEVASWPDQKQEAADLEKDSTVDAVLLRGIASARGMGVMELVEKVLSKNTLFKVAGAQIFGRRQALIDQVEKAKSIDKVHKIIVSDNGEP